MPILRVRDEDGNIVEIPAIKGGKGEPGDSGVIVGSYVGEGATNPRYIALAKNAKAALLVSMCSDFPLALVTSQQGGDAYLVDAYGDGTIDLAVARTADVKNATYTYIAFTSKGVAP